MLSLFKGLCNPNKFLKAFRTVTAQFSDFDGKDYIKTNPYYEKYANKIDKISLKSIKQKLPEAKKGTKTEVKNYSLPGTPKPDITSSSTVKKTLDSVLKMDLIKNMTKDEISDIWKEYHKKTDKISAIIPAETYSVISERAKQFPLFVYPVPKGNGFEFVMSQFENDDCHFTSLINYQAYKENAPECLTICHFPDLMTDKGIVLMRGEFDINSLSVIEAQYLANQMKLYYTCDEKDSKFSLLKLFTKQPDAFRHMDLIKELQNTTFHN